MKIIILILCVLCVNVSRKVAKSAKFNTIYYSYFSLRSSCPVEFAEQVFHRVNLCEINFARNSYCDLLILGNNDDTTIISSEIDNYQIVNNLDSLLNLWYVKHSLATDIHSQKSAVNIVDTIVPVFTDSVYIERLKELNSFVRLSYNKRVRNFIHVYTVEKRELVEIMLGLTEYYFPIFEEILDAYNLPLELKYLPIIESALYTRAVSKRGATGLWQFMYYTGKMYNLKVTTYVDERRDPVKSTYAAVQYLKDLYKIYNDWILVIAAYNCGPGNVNKAIRRSGGKTNYWDIYYRLPRETRGYIPAFIAATYVMNYYNEHNLFPKKIDLPIATDTIEVNEQLHLMQVAEVLNIQIELLRDMNPQYKKDIIPALYALKLPFEYTPQFIALQDSIFAYKDSVFFNPENIVKSPPDYSTSRYTPAPPSGDMTKLFYTVKYGDNLGFIASWYNVRISDLRYWNNIRRNLIRGGQKLVVYVPKKKADKYKKNNSMSFAQKQKMAGKSVTTTTSDEKKETATSQPSPKGKEFSDNNYIYYTVKWGDTLWDISKKYPEVSVNDIMKLNNISNARKLVPGQVIKIKKKD